MMWRSEHLENPCFWCAARSQGDRIRSVPRSVQNLQWFSFGWMVFIQKNSAAFIKPILRAGRLSCRNFKSAPLFRGVWEAVPSAPPNSNNLKFIEILEWAWQIWRLWCSTDTTDLRPAATVQFAGKHLSRHNPKWMHQPYLVTSSPEAEQHTQRIKTNTLTGWTQRSATPRASSPTFQFSLNVRHLEPWQMPRHLRRPGATEKP